MKYVIILGDGMADYPVDELEGKTPLQVATKPHIDLIAQKGRCGLLQTIDPDMPTGSAVANLAVLGYDPRVCFQGRGVLEAASMGINLLDDDMAMRVNLIYVKDGRLQSHSAGHISNEEAGEIIRDLVGFFKEAPFSIYQGLSYRHLLVLPGGNPQIQCFPPHDHIGKKIEDVMVKPLEAGAERTADILNRMILDSYKFLSVHPVNSRRRISGSQQANMLWPWSPGRKPSMKTFQEKYGISGAAISAVDLIKGLAVYAGMDVIHVPGATGLYDTNYEGKAMAAVDALTTHDLVYVHVEAADEAGHEKDLELKIKCIEDLDSRLVRIVLEELEKNGTKAVVAVLPDHPTPVALGSHVRDPVPVAIWNPQKEPDSVKSFDEESVKTGALGQMHQSDFIEHVLEKIS